MNVEVGEKQKWSDGEVALRWAVVAEYNLHRNGIEGRLERGVRTAIMERFGVSSTSIYDYVQQWEEQRNQPGVPDLSPRRKGNCGVQNLQLTEELVDMMFEYSAILRGDFTYETFAKKFNDHYEMDPPIPWRTMYGWFQRLQVIQTMSYIKPTLTPRHLLWRMNFILNKLEPSGGMFKIRDQSCRLHLDEKWFFAVREHFKRKILPGQSFTSQSTRHKSHIIKVMFIAVVGMPQMVNGEWWDGKIGMFPVTRVTQAVRTSVNRPAGADVIENVSLSADVYYEMMTGEGGILATIREKMAWARDAHIVIQHDGAPGHWGGGNNVRLRDAALEGGWNITFETQPAQSPDLNLCDLCFFNSLQKASFQIRSQSNTIEQLIATVQQAWAEYDSLKLERAWGHLFARYREILFQKGSNQISNLHTDVGARQKSGAGAMDPYVSMDVYLDAVEARDTLLNPNHEA